MAICPKMGRLHLKRRPGKNAKGPGENPGPRFLPSTASGLVVHPAHTTHTTARHSRSAAVLLRPFGHHGFRGDQKPSDRRRVLQGRSNNFGRVNDALADEVHVFAVLGVEAEAILILFKDLADDDQRVAVGRRGPSFEVDSSISESFRSIGATARSLGAPTTSAVPTFCIQNGFCPSVATITLAPSTAPRGGRVVP
jgi:hypothetical protein